MGEHKRKLLVTLNRMAADEPEDRDSIKSFLIRDLAALAPMAIRVAIEDGDPMGDVLNELVRDRADSGLALRLEPLIPAQTVALQNLAVTLGNQICQDWPQAPENLTTLESKRAIALNNLAVRLMETGMPETALKNARAAAIIYEQLADQKPWEFLPEHAVALNNVSNACVQMGRLQEALENAHLAQKIYAILIQEGALEYRPRHAASLKYLSTRIAALGRHTEGLQIARESVALWHEITNDHNPQPDEFCAGKAAALSCLATRLSEVGQVFEAVTVAEEAMHLYEYLVSRNDDAYLPDFAASTLNFANRLSDAGLHSQALEIVEDAVRTYRKLSARRTIFGRDLAGALENQSIIQARNTNQTR